MPSSVFKLIVAIMALVCMFVYWDASSAQIPPESAPVLALSIAPARGGAKITVTSSSFRSNGAIADTFTQNGANQSPALSWTAGPAGTMSYAVIAEDKGVQRQFPIDHWVLYNIPANVMNLPPNIPKLPTLANPAGAMNGLNIAKGVGYIGPKPPVGETHPYHFEVFALDIKVGLDPIKADRTSIVEAMKGHVLALGEIVGMYTGK
jgi:Raf kinase inhibitor-like YbhB/YbcL family protein